MTTDAQGRIIVGGSVDRGPGNGIDMAVARYSPDGTLDPSFSDDGIATFDSPVAADDEEFINAITLDAQGGILAAGTTNRGAGGIDFVLIRIKPDGTQDTSFGSAHSGGWVQQDMFGALDFATGIALDSQGRIIVSGSSQIGGDFDFAVARFTPAGILDLSFSGDGKASADFTPSCCDQDQASAVVVDGSDRVVIAGNTTRSSMNPDPANGFGLVRLDSAGSIDTSFGPAHTGFVTTQMGGDGAGAFALALAPGGKIVAVGSQTANSTSNFALAQYNDDGTLDDGFGFHGITIPPRVAGDTAPYEAHDVAYDSQGRLTVAGWQKTSNGDTYDIIVRRYLPNGDPTPIGTGEARVVNAGQTAAVAVDPGDRVIVAARIFGPTFAQNQFGVFRIIGDAVAPSATIVSGPADGAFINDPTPTFEFATDDPGAVIGCGFDGASASCPSPFTPTAPLADGQHTFTVSATDKGANSSSATRKFTVDTVAPDIDLKGKKKLETDAKKAKEKLRIKTSEPAELTCKVDKKKPKPCGAKFKTKLKLGKHKVIVEATDQASNSSDEAKKVKVVEKKP